MYQPEAPQKGQGPCATARGVFILASTCTPQFPRLGFAAFGVLRLSQPQPLQPRLDSALLTQQPMALPDRGGLFVFCVSQWPLPLGVTGGEGGSSRPLAADYQ